MSERRKRCFAERGSRNPFPDMPMLNTGQTKPNSRLRAKRLEVFSRRLMAALVMMRERTDTPCAALPTNAHSGRRAEQALEVAGDEIDLEVHPYAGGEAREGGDFERMGNEIDLEPAPLHAVDGEAHAVDTDRA